jgi:hypothetical protein
VGVIIRAKWLEEMPNTFVILAVVLGMDCLLGTLPTTALSADTPPVVNSNATGSPGSLEMRRAPVPFVRRAGAPAPTPIPTVEPPLPPSNATDEPEPAVSPTEPPPRAELTGAAAKAAVEADGYKRVTVLERKSNGTWRVKAYRGATEVVVTVDGAGAVTTE